MKEGGAGTFYFGPSLHYDNSEVRVNGVVRTDYIKITDGKGNPGFFFPKLTYEELCNVRVVRIK